MLGMTILDCQVPAWSPVRWGVGSMPAACRISHTVDAAIAWRAAYSGRKPEASVAILAARAARFAALALRHAALTCFFTVSMVM